jgi:hypothetical protein
VVVVISVDIAVVSLPTGSNDARPGELRDATRRLGRRTAGTAGLGHDLYVIRPDGTGRTSLDIPGMPGSGLFPDWIR